MNRIFLVLIFQFLSLILLGQDNRYTELLEITKQKGSGLVLSCYPLIETLDSWSLKRANRFRKDSLLTDSLISQIVEATKSWDTTLWTSQEFIRTVVINDRNTNLNANKLLKEWKVYDKEERKKYRRLINQWTNTDVYERPVNYLSRPVLTKDKNFGLVVEDFGKGGLCCGGQVTLYKYESGQWKDLGAIYAWKH